MKPARLAAIIVIYLGVSLAWAILGGSVTARTQTSFRRLHAQVGGLWGTPLNQQAPGLTVEETIPFTDDQGKPKTRKVYHPLVPDSSDIKVALRSDARRKGLLWYRTYAVDFDATYTVTHSYTNQPVLVARFLFPAENAVYDDFTFSVNGREAEPAGIHPEGLPISLPLPPGETATIRARYKSRGLDQWAYRFHQGVSQVNNFRLVADTDFHRLDFPERSLSPTRKESTPQGWRLTWQFAKLISGFSAGVEMPEQPNPGPMTARIAFAAPVGLLFFLAVVVIMGAMRGLNLHPMHYFFVACGFFAFHLLMAYLADHLELRLTFLTCAAVSVLLVLSYLIRAVGPDFSLKVVAPAQFIYLVLFSYAFFFEGYTGLAITIASILTLAVLMHVTAKVDWGARFARPPDAAPPP
jgi:inner membrane protein involved in colicin E2 resistance